MRPYYFTKGIDGKNMGDQLTPALLDWQGISWSLARTVAQADLMMVGSILGLVPDGWTGQVLGTGFIREGLTRDLSAASVLSVRGALTRDAAGLPASTPLGDLGVLAPQLADVVAIGGRGVIRVPHYIDQDLGRNLPDDEVVSILLPPAIFTERLARADLVITSSLHGLITADALGIPHILQLHPGVLGGLWKFTDYATALGSTVEPGVERLSDRQAMVELQEQALSLLQGLVS